MKMTAVLIATDGSSTAERAVQIGADIAKSRHMDVILLAVIDKKPIPNQIRAMAEAEHMVARPQAATDTHLANIPSWMMADIHAAAQADEDFEIRQAIANLSVKRARTILSEQKITPTSELIHEGEPDEVILDVANSEKVEMIVMGTRGLGTLKSLVIGSTSRHVAEHAPCSCIIVT
jgi:nucleotide-binding universal stress UspA family protein